MGPSFANEGFAPAGVERAATRAIELTGRVFGAHLPRARPFGRGELRIGAALAKEALSLAERLGDLLLVGQAHLLMTQVHLYSGHLATARRHAERALALYDPERDRVKAARFGFDVRQTCHTFLGHILSCQGFPDEALRHAEEAFTTAREAAHPSSEAFVLNITAFLHQLRGEVALCLERAEAALALATKQVLPYWGSYAMALSGWALVKEGQAEEGLARAARRDQCSSRHRNKGLALAFACSSRRGMPRDRRIEEGLSAVREALAAVEQTATRYFEAELARLEGELLLAPEADESRAEAAFRKAIAIARGQGARFLELWAAMSLSRLLVHQREQEEARTVLAGVYGLFTEGFDTLDLQEAKSLLEQLKA